MKCRNEIIREFHPEICDRCQSLIKSCAAIVKNIQFLHRELFSGDCFFAKAGA